MLVETATKFQLSINLSTAKALSLNAMDSAAGPIPCAVVTRVDRSRQLTRLLELGTDIYFRGADVSERHGIPAFAPKRAEARVCRHLPLVDPI